MPPLWRGQLGFQRVNAPTPGGGPTRPGVGGPGRGVSHLVKEWARRKSWPSFGVGGTPLCGPRVVAQVPQNVR